MSSDKLMLKNGKKLDERIVKKDTLIKIKNFIENSWLNDFNSGYCIYETDMNKISHVKGFYKNGRYKKSKPYNVNFFPTDSILNLIDYDSIKIKRKVKTWILYYDDYEKIKNFYEEKFIGDFIYKICKCNKIKMLSKISKLDNKIQISLKASLNYLSYEYINSKKNTPIDVLSTTNTLFAFLNLYTVLYYSFKKDDNQFKNIKNGNGWIFESINNELDFVFLNKSNSETINWLKNFSVLSLNNKKIESFNDIIEIRNLITHYLDYSKNEQSSNYILYKTFFDDGCVYFILIKDNNDIYVLKYYLKDFIEKFKELIKNII